MKKRLQLIVSREIVAEYLEIFADVLNMDQKVVQEWRHRMNDDRRVTTVSPAHHESASRDPDDNVFLNAAHAGKARYVVTNDRDLLDLPKTVQRRFRFSIVAPQQFLKQYNQEH